mgnify:CR=1 FL=1
MIIDGVHRAVGIYKGYLEKPCVENVTNILLVLFESQEIEKMQDYLKIIDNYNGNYSPLILPISLT